MLKAGLISLLLLGSDPVSPNLGLTLPQCGVTPGACCGTGCYATEITNDLSLIDSNAYSLNNPVPTAGLNINANVDFHGYSILDAGTVNAAKVLTNSVDTPADGGLAIGGTNAVAVTIGSSTATTSILGAGPKAAAYCSASGGGCMTPGTASTDTSIQAPLDQCIDLAPDGGAVGPGANTTSFCGRGGYVATPLDVDGGITASSISLSGCVDLATGCTLCGNGAGGALLTPVDGGAFGVGTAATIYVVGGATPTIGTDAGDLTLSPASGNVAAPEITTTTGYYSTGGAALMPSGAKLGTGTDNWLWVEGQAGGNWPVLLAQTTAGANPDAGINLETLGYSGVDFTPLGTSTSPSFIGTTTSLVAASNVVDAYLCLGQSHATCTTSTYSAVTNGTSLFLNAPKASGCVNIMVDGGLESSLCATTNTFGGSVAAGDNSTVAVDLIGGSAVGTVDALGGPLVLESNIAGAAVDLPGGSSNFLACLGGVYSGQDEVQCIVQPPVNTAGGLELGMSDGGTFYVTDNTNGSSVPLVTCAKGSGCTAKGLVANGNGSSAQTKILHGAAACSTTGTAISFSPSFAATPDCTCAVYDNGTILTSASCGFASAPTTSGATVFASSTTDCSDVGWICIGG